MINPWIYFLVFLKATLFSTGGPGSIPSWPYWSMGNQPGLHQLWILGRNFCLDSGYAAASVGTGCSSGI